MSFLAGARGIGGDDEPEIFAERDLPIVPFFGVDLPEVVGRESGPFEGFVRREDGSLDFARSLRSIVAKKFGLPEPAPKPNDPVAIRSSSLRDFLARHPHGEPRLTPFCSGAREDWVRGAEFCARCRNRVALIETLEASPAARVVPLRA